MANCCKCRQGTEDEEEFQLFSRLEETSDDEALESSEDGLQDNGGLQIDVESSDMQDPAGDTGDAEGVRTRSMSPAEQIDDAEFARRLHLQEQIDHHRRILEMAGVILSPFFPSIIKT